MTGLKFELDIDAEIENWDCLLLNLLILLIRVRGLATLAILATTKLLFPTNLNGETIRILLVMNAVGAKYFPLRVTHFWKRMVGE